jgi:hypothetical protein
MPRLCRHRIGPVSRGGERAQVEARRRDVEIDFSVRDMRAAHDHHGREFLVVIARDNAIPHRC